MPQRAGRSNTMRESLREQLKRMEIRREELQKSEPPIIHVVIIYILDEQSSFGKKGEYLRLFLDDRGYEKARREERDHHIEIIRYSRVRDRYLVSEQKDRVMIR